MKKTFIILAILLSLVLPSFADEEEKNTVFEVYIQKQLVIKDNSGFIKAVVDNNIAYINHLFNTGFSSDSKINKVPILFFPIYLERNKILDIILTNGANPDATFFGVSPLNFAVYRNNIKEAEILLRHGADINKKCYSDSPLNLALYKKNYEMAIFLLSKGAIPDRKSIKYSKKSKNLEIKKAFGT